MSGRRKPPEEPPAAERPALMLVRATINLPSLPAGSVVYVDPGDRYMQVCLENGVLVPAQLG